MSSNSEPLTSGRLVLVSDVGEEDVNLAGGVVLPVEESVMETLQARTLGEAAEPGSVFPLVIPDALLADLELATVTADAQGRFSVALREGAHYLGIGQRTGEGKSKSVRIDTWAELTEKDRSHNDLVIIIDGEAGVARVRRP